jgi:LysM repeat protein
MAQTIITIQSVFPAGTSVDFALWGDSTYAPAGAASTGGWQIVDRPRLVAATQWYDRSPYELDMPLAIDSEVSYGYPGGSIEAQCLCVEQWQDKAPGQLQPAVLSVTGPVPGQQRQWVVYTVSFGEALRDPIAGFRTQQQLTLSLYEYNSPIASVSGNPTPATQAAANLNAQEASQSYSIYIVNAGDTLPTVAQVVYGNASLWTLIATLNNIRDPSSISAGQVLKIPQY